MWTPYEVDRTKDRADYMMSVAEECLKDIVVEDSKGFIYHQ